ncbi:MAG: endolytic transglycosylase MltG, partial [Thermodesulfobacterium geofontis]
EEKPIIAAVYLNRLKKGMPLQADPTINYALKNFRKLTYKDYYLVKSPYNTYLKDGLPPTPICNPGEDSIKAVLFPAKVPYLYFVAKGDGTHYFSRTYKEHLEAIKKIRNDKEFFNGTSNSTLISEKKNIEKENL